MVDVLHIKLNSIFLFQKFRLVRVAELGVGEEPAAEHLRAHRQQAGHEAVRLQEGAHEGAGPAEGGRPLDHPPLLQLQVDPCPLVFPQRKIYLGQN